MTDNSTYQYDVFISYSSKDRPWVKDLLRVLEQQKIKACIDYRDFTEGMPSIKNIENAVLNSHKTLLILTPNYLTSGWTEFEHILLQTLDPANQKLRLLPLLKERCELPLRLKVLTYLNFASPEDEAEEWKRLVTALGKQPIIDKGIFFDMVAIPGGSFMMGSKERDDTQPVHKVTVSPFYIAKYPVTQEQWKEIAQSKKIDIDLDPNISHFKGNRNPVDSVTWDMAMEFCRRLSESTGKDYRLPSEAEWEYACRAGTTTRFHFADDHREMGKYAWYYGNSNGQTQAVGRKKPNQWGLYDMHGNVWEWCLDDWQREYNNRPLDGGAWFSRDNSHEGGKCMRGGSWFDDPCHSAIRALYGLYHRENYDCPLNRIGFRVVCS
jgi:formylglycine-generating enzyme required for sulfatase activity